MGGKEVGDDGSVPDEGAGTGLCDGLTHRHLARPVAPPGHGWTFTSPTRVQFQYKFLVKVALHKRRNSLS